MRRSSDSRGWRAKVAVIAPSTKCVCTCHLYLLTCTLPQLLTCTCGRRSTIVQPDFEDLARALPGGGVTNHMGRITIPNMDISTDEGVWALLQAVGGEVDAAALRCMSAKCDYLAMGMSAPTFFGGCARRTSEYSHLS